MVAFSSKKINENIYQKRFYNLAKNKPDTCNIKHENGLVIKNCDRCKISNDAYKLINHM